MKYHILGINISVLVHTALVALVFYVSHSFSPPRKSVALDFSILKSAAGKPGASTENQGSADSTKAARPKKTPPNPDQAALKSEKLPPRDVLQKKAPAQRSDKRPAPLKKKSARRTNKLKAKPEPLPQVKKTEGTKPRMAALEEKTPRDLSREETPSMTNIKENDDPVDAVPEPEMIHTHEDQQAVPSPDIYDLADILPRQGEQTEGGTGVKEEFTARGISGAPPDTNLENAGGGGGGGDGMAAYYNAFAQRRQGDRLVHRISQWHRTGFKGQKELRRIHTGQERPENRQGGMPVSQAVSNG